MNAKPTITLTGFLGKDRQLLETRSKTKVISVWREVAEMFEEVEITEEPREYIRLSLAVRERGTKGFETRWVNLIAWDLHRTAVAGLRLTRGGDRIEITGTEESYRFTTPTGEEREFRYVSVATFKNLRRKISPRTEEAAA